MATEKGHLFLTVEVDVPTGGKPEKAGDPIPLKKVGPGLLSDLDITDAEVKKLPRGSVRDATADEIEASKNRVTGAKAAEIAEAAREEETAARSAEENERRAIEAELEAEKQDRLRELAEKHEKERTAAREKATEELNKTTGAGSGAKTKRKGK